MKQLAIRSFTSPDVAPYAWSPDSREDVYFLIEMEIGAQDSVGQDVFQIMIATPEGLRKHARGKIISERNLLVISDFSSWKDLRAQVQAIVDRCTGAEWSDSATKLQRYFHWEYEDYRKP